MKTIQALIKGPILHSVAAVGTALALLMPLSGTAAESTIHNLERERATLLKTALTTNLSTEQRQERLALASRLLVDLERMVLRDKSLNGRNTPAVRRVFSNYDLGFMVHAAAERQLHIVDHWLSHMGISSATLKDSRYVRR